MFHCFNKIYYIFLQCVPILGRHFETGGYKCECKQGFEYPYEDPITYFDGQLVESEFSNLVNDKKTRQVYVLIHFKLNLVNIFSIL